MNKVLRGLVQHVFEKTLNSAADKRFEGIISRLAGDESNIETLPADGKAASATAPDDDNSHVHRWG